MWPKTGAFDENRFKPADDLRFLPDWADAESEWWRANLYYPFGAYPQDMVYALSA
jgi:hypothetical protein